MARTTFDWLSMLPDCDSSVFREYEPFWYFEIDGDVERASALMFVAAVKAGVPPVEALKLPNAVLDLFSRDVINSWPGLVGFDDEAMFEFFCSVAPAWADGVPLDDLLAGW